MPVRIPPHIKPPEPLPHTIAAFQHDGLKLAYEVHGDAGPTLVMQPGLGFPRLYFRPLAGYLARHFRCVLLDSRGCGESQGPDDDASYTCETMAGDVLALLDHLGVDRATLYGHSLGSNVVVEAALRAPARVERLVLTSFAVATELVLPFCAWVRRQATPEQDAVLRRHEEPGPALGPDGYADDYGLAAGAVWTPRVVHTPLTPSVAWHMGQAEKPAGALWGRESAFRITGNMLQIDQRARFGDLRMPVTILIGRYDQYAASTVPFARAALPDVHVVEMTESNHHTHVEEPARVAAIVGPAPDPARPALRIDVRIVAKDDADAPLVLEDALTGHRIACGPVEAEVVRNLGRPLGEVKAALVAKLGDEYDADSVGAAVDDLISSMRAAAMIDEGLSRDEIIRRQGALRIAVRDVERHEQLARVAVDVAKRVPFYRDRVAALGVGAEAMAGADFLRLPLTTKADVRANFPNRMVPDGVDVAALIESGELAVNATSGSTDERLQVLFDFKIGTLPPRYHDLWGLHAEDITIEKGAIFTSPICAGFECHLGRATMEERTRGVTLTLNSCDDPMSITDEEVRAIDHEIRAFKPGVLFVNPWYAAWLVHRMRALGLAVPHVPVVLSSYQYLTRRHRKILREAFATEDVYSYYGATDLGGALVGVECMRGTMHVREDHVHVELLPLDDVAGAGTLKKVVVTTLASPHMPLLRYDVGDVARASDKLCTCGLGPEWRPFILEGRKKDLVHDVAGRAVSTREVDDAVGDRDVDFWQLVQEGATRFVVEVIPAAGWDQSGVVARLRGVLGDAARIDVRVVDRFSPERSLKFRQTRRAA